jgi:hypothetical protein
LAAHSLNLRLEWALQEAAKQWPLEIGDDEDYHDFNSFPNDYEDDNERSSQGTTSGLLSIDQSSCSNSNIIPTEYERNRISFWKL